MGWRQIPSATDPGQSGSPSTQTNPSAQTNLPFIRPFQVRAFKLKVEKRKRIAAPLPPPTPEPAKRKPPGRPKIFPSPKLEHHQFFDRTVAASKSGTFAKRLNTSQADLLLTRWWDLRAPKSSKASKNWRAFIAKNIKGEEYLKDLKDTLEPAFVVYLFAYGYTVRHPRDRSEIDEVFPYDLVAREFLQDLDVGRIPMSVLGTWKTLEPRVDGYIVAEILDYRSHCLDFQTLLKQTDQNVSIQPAKRRALLKPTEESLVHELSTRAYSKRVHGVGREIGWTDSDWVTFGRVVLGNDPPPICIDPSTVVFSLASIVNYNRQKFNILKKARYRRRLSLMRSAIEDQVDELELWGSADCDNVNGASSLNTAYTSHDEKPHGRSPTKRLEKLPMAKEMKDVRPSSVSVSAHQPTRVLRFSTPHRLSLMPAKLRLPEGRRVEIHRDVDDYWIVAIVFFVNPKFDNNVKPADFSRENQKTPNVITHHFTSFREATAFIEELKQQYSREQRQLQYDSLEHCNTLTDCAIDIDKVFLQVEPDVEHTHEYISNNNTIITGAATPNGGGSGGGVTFPEQNFTPQPLSTNIPPIPMSQC